MIHMHIYEIRAQHMYDKHTRRFSSGSLHSCKLLLSTAELIHTYEYSIASELYENEYRGLQGFFVSPWDLLQLWSTAYTAEC